MLTCGACGRECRSRWGYCWRPGPCNAARLKAIRQSKDDEIAALKALLRKWAVQ
jgi:hypothetical protein